MTEYPNLNFDVKVTEHPILVTGATGYIASHIIERLLLKGYRVRGTVRDPNKPESFEYLTKMKNSENLELVRGNLTEKEGWKEAVKGCEYVLHTASPFVLDVKDAKKDLVDPAVNGVLHVLDACLAVNAEAEETGQGVKVKKVVMTSSVAAISDCFENGRVYNEEDWNTTSNLRTNPYYYSKTEAERTAHKFWQDHDKPFKLAVINPFATIGPSHRPTVNQSVETFERFLNGMDIGIPRIGVGYVDVRDVADAHILAMENLEAEGRFIINEGAYTWPELAHKCRELYPRHPIPRYTFPTFCVKAVVATTFPRGQRDFVFGSLDRIPQLDNTRSKEILGLKYHDMDKSIKDCCDNLIELGFVPAEPKAKMFGIFHG